MGQTPINFLTGRFRTLTDWFRHDSLAFLLALLLLFTLFSPVQAHTEGAMRLAAAPAGPFKLTAWTSPDPARTGEIHVAVSVVLAEDASPVLGANVQVRLTPLDNDNPELVATATAEDATNKFLYEAILSPETAGNYRVTIIVSDGGLRGEADFEMAVSTGINLGWLIPVTVIVGLLALALWKRSKHAGPSHS